MSMGKALIPVLVCLLLLSACAYIVLPEDLDAPLSAASKGWSGVVTNIGASESGGLHIDITLRNETGAWSAMQAIAGKPAVLTSGGQSTDCEPVFVSTGGHRLAPGFQMRGFIAGTKDQPELQVVYVECPVAEAAAGATLAIDYSYVVGQYNYYEPDATRAEATLELELDQVASDLTYPVAETVEGLIQKPDVEIVAINDVVLTLVAIERSDTGLHLAWQTSNPGEYPSYVHIGNPPVIGADGVIYGRYETPDLASVPISPAGEQAEWTTEVAVPQDARGLYILLSVESGKQRLYANYAIDISDQ